MQIASSHPDPRSAEYGLQRPAGYKVSISASVEAGAGLKLNSCNRAIAGKAVHVVGILVTGVCLLQALLCFVGASGLPQFFCLPPTDGLPNGPIRWFWDFARVLLGVWYWSFCAVIAHSMFELFAEKLDHQYKVNRNSARSETERTFRREDRRAYRAELLVQRRR